MAQVLDPLETIAILVPVLIANGSPVLLAKGTPIDLGRRLRDGRRILGDGKTFEGYLLGSLYGTSVGLFLLSLFNLPVEDVAPLVVAVNAGLLGDIVAAFFKRRAGLERGEQAPILDQLDFYAGALFALALLGYACDPTIVLILVPIVYFLHRGTNIIAYRAGLKKEPW